jgi:hypothetical protein
MKGNDGRKSCGGSKVRAMVRKVTSRLIRLTFPVRPQSAVRCLRGKVSLFPVCGFAEMEAKTRILGITLIDPNCGSTPQIVFVSVAEEDFNRHT